MEITITGQVIAWYGAILSTALAVVTVLRYIGERVQIKVSAKQLWRVKESGAERDEIIRLQAVNVGKRAVTIVSGGLELANGATGIALYSSYGKQLPCKLSEGECCSLWAFAAEIRNAEQEAHSKVVSASFEDAAGRRFQKKFRTRPTMAELEQGED